MAAAAHSASTGIDRGTARPSLIIHMVRHFVDGLVSHACGCDDLDNFGRWDGGPASAVLSNELPGLRARLPLFTLHRLASPVAPHYMD